MIDRDLAMRVIQHSRNHGKASACAEFNLSAQKVDRIILNHKKNGYEGFTKPQVKTSYLCNADSFLRKPLTGVIKNER